LILDNLKKIRYRISSAAERSGRDPKRVGLVVVTKYATLRQVEEVIASGLAAELGESRIQAAQARKLELGAPAAQVRWRLIGHLQSNKAAKAVELFDAVDSLDAPRTALALEKVLAALGRRLPVLVQVKLSDSATQSGVRPEELPALLEALLAYPHLEPRGLMAIAPLEDSPESARPHFRRMRRLFDSFFADKAEAQLSMGMSGDYEVAVEEGATLVRVGSAVFSE
jgi:pyridoxal phosphate enzyme (YggS family)